MSVDILIDRNDLNRSWNIGNSSFRVLEPLIEKRFQHDSEALEAILGGAGLGGIALYVIADGWSRGLANRVAQGLLDIANDIACGSVDFYEYDSAEQERESRNKFAQLVSLLHEFLQKDDRS